MKFLKQIFFLVLIAALIVCAILAYMAINKIPFTRDLEWKMTIYQYDPQGNFLGTFPATLSATQYDFLIDGHNNVSFRGNGELDGLESDNFIFKLICDGQIFDEGFGDAGDRIVSSAGDDILGGLMRWLDGQSMMQFAIIRIFPDRQAICFFYADSFYVGVPDEYADPLSVLDAAQLPQWEG